MGRFEWKDGRVAMAALIAIGSAFVWLWVYRGDFGACVVGKVDEPLEKMVAMLDSTIDLGIKLSVALVGVASAVLLGLKSGLVLRPWSKILLLVAATLFAQSAGAGVYWKLEVANSWLNRCLNLIYEPLVQRAFEASLLFFALGLGCAVVLLIVAAFGTFSGEENAVD